MRYFDNSPFKTNKIKDLFINSDRRNTNNSDEYLSVVRDVGVIKYSERGDSGNKTSDSPEKYKMVDVGDLVINPMNVTIGSVGVSEYSGCLSGVYLVLKPKTSVNSKYYHYLFHDKGFQKYLKTISYGIMEIRESLNKTEFFQFKIPKPSVDEQEEIVSFLDKKTNQINELIKKIEQKIKLLKEKRTSLINEVVTKGLNPNVEMKDSGVEWLGEVPKHWRIIRLKLLGSFSNGLSKSSEYFGKGFPFYSYGDVYNNRSLPDIPSDMVESDDSDQRKCSVERGDIFFTRTSESTDDIGATSVCLKTLPHSTFSGFIIRFRPYKERFLPEYSKYFFQNHYKKSFIESRMNIVTRSSLSQSILGSVLVTFPEEKEEQQEIIEYLDYQTHTIDKNILQEEERVKLLKKYKQSLISEVVTGKKRVV